MDDLYKRLGVTPKATQKEIRSAYRRRARDSHPDVSKSPETADQFARITEAYRILSDPERRARYDRGETVNPKPVAFYASHRQEWLAWERKINHVVDEVIETERQETRTRGQIVTVLVTLFLSTFIFALIKPIRFNPLDWPIATVAGILSFVGLLYLVTVIRKGLEHYTYRPESPSITHPTDPPSQPFARGKALTFLAVGYFGSLGSGMILDAASGGAFSGGAFPNDAMMGALLFPPILVLIIGMLRRAGEFMEGW
jgi:hypothetical protein